MGYCICTIYFNVLYLLVAVPNRNTGNFLDPGLPGTGLQGSMGKGEAEAGPGPLLGWRKISWNLAEMEET
jgi:hypothetical protein